MPMESFNPVVPASDLGAEVAFWTKLLGAEPTFVDGDRWAQFDVGGRRLAVAGADRVVDSTALMVKVRGLDEAVAQLRELGIEPGTVARGPHERRCSCTSPSGTTVILYEPA